MLEIFHPTIKEIPGKLLKIKYHDPKHFFLGLTHGDTFISARMLTEMLTHGRYLYLHSFKILERPP